jgi:hypothetical protein
MSQLMKRIGPSCAVLGLVVWCCWPYLAASGSSFSGPQETKLPRIARNVLDPEIRKPSQRDPFQVKADQADQRATFAPLAAMGKLFRKIKEDRQWLADRQAARATTRLPSDVPATPDELSKSLRLQATYLRLDERLAVINNRIYAEGEDVALPGSDKLSCTVQHVLSDRVILDIRGETVNLAYPAALGSAKRDQPPNTPTIPTPGDYPPGDAAHLPGSRSRETSGPNSHEFGYVLAAPTTHTCPTRQA